MEMLRRHLWVIDLAGIALGAVVSGQAAASLMASALPRPPAPHTAPAPPRLTHGNSSHVWLTVERNGMLMRVEQTSLGRSAHGSSHCDGI